MRSFVLLLLLLLLFQISCRSPSEAQLFQIFDWGGLDPEAYGFDKEALEQAVQEASRMDFFTSLLVVRRGDLVLEVYYNKCQPDQRHEIRSATKSVVSALIGIALENGHLDSVEQKLVDFFPEYVNETMDPRKRNVTIHHLLTMTSGFPSDNQAEALFTNDPDEMGQIFNMPLSSNPGSQFSYSSVGTHLLSGILTRATNQSTKEFAMTNLCIPLGIDIPFWIRDPMGFYYGGSGIEMTSRDMAHFGQLYLNGGTFSDQRIIPSDWIQKSFQTHVGQDEEGYGYLWWLGMMDNHAVQMAIGYGGQYIILVSDLDMVVVTTSLFPNSTAEENTRYDQIQNFVEDFILAAVVE